ncbi:MAG: sigma-70 family RNA polymerase sigma factor [Armatimonadetes bacterium]|nr:sigma-70 family RNA polymerase sigma factor [Armatimonadota bacterium]MBS1711237.1 sigma-70 family RNA polymerase sigma factor [Armatimonadota bacterium]MBX3108911.1 sigma-70 family RNA polymerase sigma factor [Fimbriimonadaceae bacterium]
MFCIRGFIVVSIDFDLASDRTGDFERLRRETERKAYSMALQLTRNVSDAQDLLQETYCKAWRGFGGYLPDRPFLNWILRIMQRAYLDERRRDNPVRRAESLEAGAEFGYASHELSVVDPHEGPDSGLIRNELAAQVRSALAELPHSYREAIELCDLAGVGYQQIADRQNTTVGTVRSRIHRGRKLLRKILSDRGVRPGF